MGSPPGAVAPAASPRGAAERSMLASDAMASASGAPRRPALHDRHVALGAKLAPFGGWEMPLQYAGVVREHTAVRERVGVFDVSHLGTVLVRGVAAAAYINSTMTNDL